MPQYDGSVRIKTEIETKQARVQMLSLENQIVKTADHISNLKSKLSSLGDAKIGTEQYTRLTQQLEYAENQLIILNEKHDILKLKQQQVEDQAVKTGTSFQRLGSLIKKAFQDGVSAANSAKEVGEAADQSQKSIVGMVDSLKYAMEMIKNGFKDIPAAAIGSIKNMVGSVKQKFADMKDSVISSIKEIPHKIKELAYGTANVFKVIGSSIINAFVHPIQTMKNVAKTSFFVVKKSASGLLLVLQKTANIVKSGLVGAFKKLGSVAKSAFSWITGGVKSSNGMFQGGLKNILKYGLGIRSLFVLVNKLRSAIKEGFSNLVESGVGGFKEKVESLKASLLTLKNSFAAAFSPIVQAVIPYIQQLVTWLTNATDAMGQFIAAAMGQKKYTRAVKQTTAALEDQEKAQNKQLSGLDRLNNITNGSSSDTSVSPMFEESEVESKFGNIAQWFKDMWANANFYEIGSVLGEKIKSGLQNIPWDNIKNTARKLASSLATLINGFVETEDLGYLIGNTLAQGINTGFSFLNEFVHKLDWGGIGHFIADSINGWMNGIDWDLIRDTLQTGARGIADTINNFAKDFDWKKAAKTVSEFFKNIFDFVSNTIENIDWQELGIKVKEFIVGIDWAGVADSFFRAIGAALGGLAGFLWGIIKSAWDDMVNWWYDAAYDDGGFTMSGLLNGILDYHKNLDKWVKEHISKPFVDAFKKAFKINSPSKVMQELGVYVIEGLFNGLKSMWDSVKNWFTDKLEWLTGKVRDISDLIKSVSRSVASVGSIGASIGGSVISRYAVTYALSDDNIPGYATGQVIPRSMKKHLAYLGDNNQETEVVSPLSTIKKAVTEAMAENGGGNGQVIEVHAHFNWNNTEVAEVVQKVSREYFKQYGKPLVQI